MLGYSHYFGDVQAEQIREPLVSSHFWRRAHIFYSSIAPFPANRITQQTGNELYSQADKSLNSISTKFICLLVIFRGDFHPWVFSQAALVPHCLWLLSGLLLHPNSRLCPLSFLLSFDAACRCLLSYLLPLALHQRGEIKKMEVSPGRLFSHWSLARD